MLVTITNISSGLVYVSTACRTIPISGSISFSRTEADMDRDLQLKQLVVDGLVSVSFVKEATDNTSMAWNPKMLTYSNSTRPLATAVPASIMIFNTDDNAINVSDGTNWRDAAGNIT